jgi:hypothetical protein
MTIAAALVPAIEARKVVRLKRGALYGGINDEVPTVIRREI